MKINIKKDKLMLDFKYHPRIVATVKSITGRRYNPKDKSWEIPIENVGETLEKLEPLGFVPHIEVKKILGEQQTAIEASEMLKTDHKYEGDLPLFDFQKTGASFIRNLPAVLLADVPGLGKTIQTIAALEDDPGPHLVLCPASLKFGWEEEIKKWMPSDTVQVINGSKDERKKQWATKVKWYIANYELLIHDFDILEAF